MADGPASILSSSQSVGLIVPKSAKEASMTIKIIPNDKGNPSGKLADAELHFTSGRLEGLKLIGFGIWERRTGGRNVTFPARQHSINGERRSLALLRPALDNGEGQERIKSLILKEYAKHETEVSQAVR
jgi:hypothetical protein